MLANWTPVIVPLGFQSFDFFNMLSVFPADDGSFLEALAASRGVTILIVFALAIVLFIIF